MQLNKQQLKQIIKEELDQFLQEKQAMFAQIEKDVKAYNKMAQNYAFGDTIYGQPRRREPEPVPILLRQIEIVVSNSNDPEGEKLIDRIKGYMKKGVVTSDRTHKEKNNLRDVARYEKLIPRPIIQTPADQMGPLGKDSFLSRFMKEE